MLKNNEAGSPEDKKIIGGLEKELADLGLPPIENAEEEENLEKTGYETTDGDEENESEKNDDDESDEDELEDDESEEDEEEDDSAEDDTDEDEDEDSDEEEDDDEDKGSQKKTPKKYIPIAKYKAKRAADATKISSLEGMVKTLTESLAKGKDTEVDDEVKKMAEELGIDDPDNFQKVVAFLEKKISDKVKPDPELVKTLEDYKKAQQDKQDRDYFDDQWSEIVPQLEKEFPNADKKEIKVAKALMDKIWHSKKWHSYEIDYVFFKNKSEFAKVISPRNKGLETGGGVNHFQSGKKGDKNAFLIPEGGSEDDIMRAANAINDMMSKSNPLRAVESKKI